MKIPKGSKRIKIKSINIDKIFAEFCGVPLLFISKIDHSIYFCYYIGIHWFLASPINNIDDLIKNKLSLLDILKNNTLLIHYCENFVLRAWRIDILRVPEELLPNQGIFLYC